uniref:Uncharacterized protein n=1 Tax=Setaria italica TaxID=4555 RepID=K4APJ1_SETIT
MEEYNNILLIRFSNKEPQGATKKQLETRSTMSKLR